MKIPPCFCVLALLALLLSPATAADSALDRQPLTPAQIEELVSPIALYPDPLVALILPASTFPSDVVLAARFLERGGSPDNTEAQPWDDSVQALARYREVIDYLDNNLEWTRRLGLCFLDQPDDVMDAIQMVRIRAKAAGLLRDTPEQHVIVEVDEICIVPAQPTIIYVPRYDPWIICRPTIPVYHGAFLTFGIGWRVGTWLNFDCDWRARSVRIVHRPAQWYHSPNWDNRDRYRQFTATNWTRRTSHPRHDDRFDRSPRSAAYQVPGRDHRDWSERNRSDGRRDNDHRPNNGHSSYNSNDRSRDWQNRRQAETRNRQQADLNPAGPAVIPPVATPLPQVSPPTQTYRRPEGRTQPSQERRHSPDNSRRDHGNPPAVRTAPPRSESASTSQDSHRSRPQVSSQPAPGRRPETSERSDRRQNDQRRESGSSQRSSDRIIERDEQAR